MTDTDKRSQHYLPQLLMRQFCVPDTRKKAVAFLNTHTGAHVPTASIRKQCARDFLYGRDGKAEDHFEKLEGATAEAIKRVISEGAPPDADADAGVALTAFAALQYGRTPDAAAVMEEHATAIARGAAGFRPASPTVREEAKHIRIKYPTPELYSAVTSLQAAPVLHDLATVLVYNTTAIEFVLSDVGVVFHNQWCFAIKSRGVLGAACRGLQVFLPISPRHMLIKYDPEVYFIWPDTRRCVRVQSTRQVARLNLLQCSAAERCVYFTGDTRTLASLQALQASIRHTTPEQRVPRATFVNRDDTQQVVHTYRRLHDVSVQLAWLRVHEGPARIPELARGGIHRTKAIAVARRLGYQAEPLRGPRVDRTEFVRVID